MVNSRASLLLASLILTLSFMPSAQSATEMIVETSEASAVDVQKFKASHVTAKPKIGLALGGGGARGAAIVGVLEILEKEGIKIDYIAGTSVGAIVGGLYDAGVPLPTLRKDAETGQIMRKFMTEPLALRLLLEPIYIMPRVLGAKPYDGLYAGGSFRKYLQKTLPENKSTIESLKIPFNAVSFNVLDGKPYRITSGNLGRAMAASSAVPSLRKPIVICDGLFVDGGVACNLPVKQCREMGADFVIGVNIDQPFPVAPLQQFRKPGSIATRMINWALWDVDREQEKLADVVIHPDTGSMTLITTSKKEAKRAYHAGLEAARQAMPQLRQKLESRQTLSAQ